MISKTNKTSNINDIRSKLETVLGAAFIDGNSIDILRNGVEIFPAMLEAIKAAEKRIEFSTFVYWTGEPARHFAEALAERARAGVEVRALIDAYGGKEMSDDDKALIESAGVKLEFFRPFSDFDLSKSDNRTHRKILICDSAVAFTGGVGIAAEWAGDARNASEWRDTHFRLRGPSVMHIRAGFIRDWVEATNSLEDTVSLVNRPEKAGENSIQTVLASAPVGLSPVAILQDILISLAQEELIIVTPYFTPREESVDLLCEAIGRGVAVRVMMPGPHVDKMFSELAGSQEIYKLLKAGVDIHIYQPTMLHQKLILVDQTLASVGSANFNQRSAKKDNEIVLNILNDEVAAQLRADFEKDLECCSKARAEDWRNRGFLRKSLEKIVHMVKAEV